MPKKYEVVETRAVLKRDRTSRGYQFSVEQLEVESLIQDYYDFKPHENKRVKVIIMIEENEEVKQKVFDNLFDECIKLRKALESIVADFPDTRAGLTAKEALGE